jgi:hypothetical protein
MMMSNLHVIQAPKRPETGIAELDQLLHPSRYYDEPSDVVRDHRLSLAERRAILSSWASDACAVVSCPMLRGAPFGKQPVEVEKILDALKELDRIEAQYRQFGALLQAPSSCSAPSSEMMQ